MVIDHDKDAVEVTVTNRLHSLRRSLPISQLLRVDADLVGEFIENAHAKLKELQ